MKFISQLLKLSANNIQPIKRLTVSQWADSHRILSQKSSSTPGKWSTDRTPYLREIMDNLSIGSPVQRVVMKFCAQVGKTEVLLNWIGSIMAHDPAPTLAVVPTLEVRKKWVKQRLDPMISETPVLHDLMKIKSRDSANAEDLKDFPGGILVIAGANSPASLASMPIQNVLLDEVDRFPWEAGEEGDPLGLIDERTKTFPRRKTVLVSTPTTKDQSRIDEEYNASDMRQYHVPCPHCHEKQALVWRHPDGTFGLMKNPKTGQISYICRHCGAEIDEHHKPWMLAQGVWIARHPDRSGRPVRGYTLSGLYSPIGLGFTWAEIYKSWKASQSDSAKLKRFINTTLGEVWEEQGEQLDSVALITRCEDYEKLNIQTELITSFTDVQKDRLETTIVHWALDEECYPTAHIIQPGDTAGDDVWADLAEMLEQEKVQLAGIDSGYNTESVYNFVQNRSWCVACKGVSGMHRPLVEDERKRRQRLRYRRKKGVAPEPVGVDQGKAILFARLNISKPGPGYIHFPIHPDFDDEYFAQLTAEKLVTRVKNGRQSQVWVQQRARNEALDCMVGNLVVKRLQGVLTPKRSPPHRQQSVAQQQTAAAANPAASTSNRSNIAKSDWGSRL